MRTTLDIEDDVLQAARELARQRGVSVGRVISDLVRQALTPPAPGQIRNGVPLFPIQPGAQVVTPELINQLRDELG
ncbi:MAG: CopG family transcriptional regulator [Chloroflexaceae bacterium]